MDLWNDIEVTVVAYVLLKRNCADQKESSKRRY